MTKLFNPTTPRPEWDDQMKEQCLIAFVKKYYPDYSEDTTTDEEYKNTGIFQSLDRHWNLGWYIADLARDLMYDGWDYEQVKELEEDKDLDWFANQYLEGQVIEWVKSINIENPFKHLDKVLITDGPYKGKQGVVLVENYEYALKAGKVIVRLPQHEEETKKMQANGGTGTVVGSRIEWEYLDLLERME